MTASTKATGHQYSDSEQVQRGPCVTAVAACCLNSAVMLSLADEGYPRRRELNNKQSELLVRSAHIVDEMYAALQTALADITSNGSGGGFAALEIRNALSKARDGRSSTEERTTGTGNIVP